jgi:hypothetical protein
MKHRPVLSRHLAQQPPDNNDLTAVFQRHQHRSVFTADAFAVGTTYSLAEHPLKRRIGIAVAEISVFHLDLKGRPGAACIKF